MSLRGRRLRLVALYHSRSVIYLTFSLLLPSQKGADALFELRHRHRLASRPTHPAMDRILDHQRAEAVVTLPAYELEDERMILGVLAAGPAAAEPTSRQRRPLAYPAVH